MANTTLTVEVFNGSAPFSIKASLYKGTEFILGITSPGSFEHEFKNLAGHYTLLISGPNPLGPDGKTVITLDASQITLKPESDSSPAVRKGKAYLVNFNFKA
ncbi:MAG: hypothetical protein EOO13_18220 [Chitinophagaceae bacterium]|nr:MAG: hypothetical protein EOO13_18220 [Chitinophagaceae bacterium]